VSLAADPLLRAALGQRADRRLEPAPARRVHGGCISDCFEWHSDRGPLFVKLAPAAALDGFEGEAEGLRELTRAGAIRVPGVLAVVATERHAALALEWLDLGGGDGGSAARLGAGLARQHAVTAPGFGWHRDNTIGSTPQANCWSGDWVGFLREQRLGPQLARAAANGYGGRLQRLGERLCIRLPAFFGGYEPVASLLHGDLWGGNWATDRAGRPVVFDPAVYFGDREADLAMTRLFGGFGPDFYRAYQEGWPLHPDAASRVPLYNLYHVLNHLNLFGGGYLRQAEGLLGQLLADVG